ncbi:MAG TPA: hypothetical protein VF942_02865, partial [Acidimicrobiales bacterium]
MADSDDRRDELIDRVVALASERFGSEQVGEIEPFIRQYYRRVALEDLDSNVPGSNVPGSNVGDLYGAALAHF